jgi:hypothetical protein
MVSGESANPSNAHLLELANYFKIKNAHNIIDQVKAVIYNWKAYAKQCNVSADSRNKIEKVIGKKQS